jgi:small membrane protein
MPIQFILVVVIIVIVARLIYRLKNKDINRVAFLGWLVIWLLAAGVVIFPELSSYLANRVGVTRGADLVLYIAVIVLFYLVFRLLMRIERLEKSITKLIQDLAISENKEK